MRKTRKSYDGNQEYEKKIEERNDADMGIRSVEFGEDIAEVPDEYQKREVEGQFEGQQDNTDY